MCENIGKEEAVREGKAVFLEARRLATKISMVLCEQKAETVTGITALSLVLNSTIKVNALIDAQENNKESTTMMINVILRTIMLDIGKVGYENLYEYMKERSYGTN